MFLFSVMFSGVISSAVFVAKSVSVRLNAGSVGDRQVKWVCVYVCVCVCVYNFHHLQEQSVPSQCY